MKPIVILRYFDCRGRAQVFRYLLSERNIEFTDERVPFDDNWHAWSNLKPDSDKSGIFNRLPILHWNGDTIAETWVIAQFLHQTLDGHKYTDQQNMLIQMLQSSILEDVGSIYTVLNLDLLYQGIDEKKAAEDTMTRLSGNFKKYQDILANGRFSYLAAETPSLADYWLYEALTASKIVFDPIKESLFNELPDLANFIETMEKRPGMKTAIQLIPDCLTARPDHQQRLEALYLKLSVSV